MNIDTHIHTNADISVILIKLILCIYSILLEVSLISYTELVKA